MRFFVDSLLFPTLGGEGFNKGLWSVELWTHQEYPEALRQCVGEGIFVEAKAKYARFAGEESAWALKYPEIRI